MARRTGLSGFLEHDINETGTFTAFDLIEEFELGWDGNELNENIGVGGQSAVARGMVWPIGSATTKLQTDNLLNCIIRTSISSLPPVIEQIRGGILDETNGSLTHYDCYINRAEISCEVDGFVMTSYEWLALDYSYGTITSGTQASHITTTPFIWHAGDVQFDSSRYSCQSWRITIENNIEALTSLDQKSAGSQRLPEALRVGNYKVTLEAEFQEYPTYFDYGLDDLSSSTVTFYATAQNTDGTPQTFTVDMTGGNGLHITSQPIRVSGAGEDVITYSVSAESLTNDLNVLSLSIA